MAGAPPMSVGRAIVRVLRSDARWRPGVDDYDALARNKLKESMFNNLRITLRFVIVLSAFWLSGAVVIAVSYWGLSSARDSLKTVHDRAMVPALMASDLMDLTVQNRLQVILAFQHAPESPMASIHGHEVSVHLNAITANRDRITQIIKTIESSITDPDEKTVFDATRSSRMAWVAQLDEATKAIQAGNYQSEVMARFLKAGSEDGEAVVKATGQYRDFQIARADAALKAAQQRYEIGLMVFAFATFVLGLPASLMGLLLLARMVGGFAGSMPQPAPSHPTTLRSRWSLRAAMRSVPCSRRWKPCAATCTT